MSNVIPFVSSSPPPMDDDDATFKWDDDDDDYGNFASASSVSATTIASDSSTTTNWSTSETSVIAEDAPSNKPPIKSDSKTFCDEREFNISNSNCNRPENIFSGDQNLNRILPQLQSNESDGNNDNFQDFAHFGSAQFSNSPAHVANEETENKPSPEEVSVSPIPPNSAARDDEKVEFEEFAQFNDGTDNWEHSQISKPELSELSQNENKINSTTAPSFKDMESLSDDLETVQPDTESIGSVHLKNNDSIYSCASTVDSGMFSADMSPSCQPGQVSETCLYTEKEESIANSHALTPDTSSSSSLASGQSHEDTNLQDALAESYHKNDTSFNNKNISGDCVTSDSSSCDGDGGNNFKNQESGFNGSDVVGSCDNVSQEGHSGKFSDSEKVYVEGDLREESNEVSTTAQRVETSNHSSSSRGHEAAVGDIGSSAGFLASPSVIEEVVEVHAVLHGSDNSIRRDCTVESSGESVSVVEAMPVRECESETTDSDKDNGNIVVEDERSIHLRDDESGHDSSAECEEVSDDPSDLVCEDDPTSTKDKDESVITEYNREAVGVDERVGNCETSALVTSSVPGSCLPKSTEAIKDCEDFIEDEEEFGEFGITIGQRDEGEDDGSNEVAPITFRTSVCESAADEEDVDEFTFDRERPPALDDEGDSSSEEARKGGSKDISDGEDIDDFGEFDSAQNLLPSSSSVSINKSDDREDGFGDFGKSQAADDGEWADFGSAPTPGGSGSFSPPTTRQASVSALPNQSKAQKLRQAVVSCFPDASVQSAVDHSKMESVDSDGHEEQSHGEDHGESPPGNDEGPLPLDTVVDLGLSNTVEAKQQTWTVVQHPAKKDPKVKLWSHLKDVDSCHALMYGWHTSHCSKEVFATLHIDTQNILFTHKKQAVPFFASGLGILEPIRGGGAAQDRKKEKSIIPATKPILLESSKHDNHLSPATQDIPPVDFDWSSSGLTNPLTANTLDLDFLVIQGSDSYEKTSVFKTDSQNVTPSALQPLEEIMKKTTPTAKLSTNEVWSPEAVRVLGKMPDLSFMQSRVLMFPVKQ